MAQRPQAPTGNDAYGLVRIVARLMQGGDRLSPLPNTATFRCRCRFHQQHVSLPPTVIRDPRTPHVLVDAT
jgi:hypothetical protein